MRPPLPRGPSVSPSPGSPDEHELEASSAPTVRAAREVQFLRRRCELREAPVAGSGGQPLRNPQRAALTPKWGRFTHRPLAEGVFAGAEAPVPCPPRDPECRQASTSPSATSEDYSPARAVGASAAREVQDSRGWQRRRVARDVEAPHRSGPPPWRSVRTATTLKGGRPICKAFNDDRGCTERADQCPRGAAHVCDILFPDGRICAGEHPRGECRMRRHSVSSDPGRDQSL